MVFSSPIFLNFFLPATLFLVIAAHRLGGVRLSNPILLFASVIFYIWGIGASFAPVLFASIVVNYALGLYADDARRRGAPLQPPVALAAVLNIGLLAWFKYANFFIAETAPLRDLLGVEDFVWKEIVLPIGISFFTFQAMSYVFDVASGAAKALRNPFDFALYIVLFPQLIAGPIVRYGLVAEQIRNRTVTLGGFRAGSVRFLHGLVKKVVIADAAGAIADPVFSLPGNELTAGAAWLGAIAYFVQIYFDFSGYSDMAIGLGRMFGFDFPMNFDRPYAAVSMTDFWRRWHMTLSGWFRDYVYIPLGGSRRGDGRTFVNLWVVFVLTGIWHGANWTFLAWGLYHGALLIGERIFGIRDVAPGSSLIVLAARRCAVIALVLVGWIIFRSPTLDAAMNMLNAMAGFNRDAVADDLATRLSAFDKSVTAVGFLVAVLPPARFRGHEAYLGRMGRFATALLVGVAWPFALLKVLASGYSPFLYFQF